MAELVNTFSWSLSRQQMFDDCRRRYFVHYYASWGGWKDDAEALARQAYRLKQIVSLEMWVGDILHRLIEGQMRRLQRGYRPLPNPLREQARSLLNTEWKQSVEKRWRENAKHNRNLFEHYYGIEIAEPRRADIRDRLFTCVDHFCASPHLDPLIVADPKAWLAIEQLDTFLVDGIAAFVKLDVAVRLGGQTLIIDWKSGRPADRDLHQATCYGLYAMQKWNAALSDLRALLVYLLGNETKQQAIAPQQALQMQEQIVSGIHAMRAVLADPVANTARQEDFPMTENRRLCRRCNFHEICFGPGPIAVSEEP